MQCGTELSNNCSNCDAVLQADARFCMHCGEPVLHLTPVDEMNLGRLAAAAPAPLVEKVRAAESLSGERRTVTILHLDVVRSTAIAGKIGEEEWAAIMTSAYDRFAQVIFGYEGTIARLLGDALVAFFGAPVIHEDDPVRAVRAALDLVEIAQELNAEFRSTSKIDFEVRICLNTGPIVLGSVGGDLRYEFTPVGGVVNLAARLKFAAEPMTVLLSEYTHAFVAPIFEFDDPELVEVADRPEPVRVYQLLGKKSTPGSLRGLAGFESPMVGRERELRSLLNLCSAIRAGLGRAVLISGEPGMGKTRLIREWKSSIGEQKMTLDPNWIEGRCLSYGQGLAYHLIVDLLYWIMRIPQGVAELEVHRAWNDLMGEYYDEKIDSKESQEVYPYLGHLLSLKFDEKTRTLVQSLDPQTLQTKYKSALRSLLLRISSRQPIIIILEDLHWADPSSVELLVQILPVISSESILLCMVTRIEQDTPGWKLITSAREVLGGSITEINLNALSQNESREMVANLLEVEALPEKTRNLILQKSEGNPFFVEEVIRMLIDRRAIVQQNGDWVAGENIEQINIPDNLQGLLMARIDRLPEDVKHTLRVASVIGRQFPVKVLEQVLGEKLA
jgi:class 3 adenylate cyclase